MLLLNKNGTNFISDLLYYSSLQCRINIFSSSGDGGKNVELEKILQFNIFVVKFKKKKKFRTKF